MQVFDDRPCALGEGPLWHPERGQLFWFDILSRRLLTRDTDGSNAWQFDELVSAAGWIDRDTLLIASETGLLRFDLRDGSHRRICDLEADNAATRSNDGRADPMGGFWIGTMGKRAEKSAGAIYRLYRGELRRIFADISIPNAICFAPSHDLAYFADSGESKVWRVALDPEGWPKGMPEVFLDLSGGDPSPDGAVIDAQGRMWLSEWNGGCIGLWDTNGGLIERLAVPAPQVTCPAFGGPDRATLFCTSAFIGMSETAYAASNRSGQTFMTKTESSGLAEHRVIV